MALETRRRHKAQRRPEREERPIVVRGVQLEDENASKTPGKTPNPLLPRGERDTLKPLGTSIYALLLKFFTDAPMCRIRVLQGGRPSRHSVNCNQPIFGKRSLRRGIGFHTLRVLTATVRQFRRMVEVEI